MVKAVRTGGEDVYPDEVEAILKYHPRIVDAAVVGVDDVQLGKRLVAIVQPKPGETIEVEDVVQFFVGRIAGFKVPKQVINVDVVKRVPLRGQMKPDYDWALAVASGQSAATT